MRDGVDYVPMPTYKIWLIQLLNIAGLGPIFGPILGALYGPSALLWIVIGCIFAGAVHDYFAGMLSVRNNGDSVPNIVGRELGPVFRQFMNYFSVILLLLVGIVFVLGPGKLLSQLTGWPVNYWVAAIFAYYFLATILPIDKIIGRFYPLFGALLLFMSVGLTVTMILSPEHELLPRGLHLNNVHPKDLPIWPLMFIRITSYNVCYTKLLRRWPGMSPISPTTVCCKTTVSSPSRTWAPPLRRASRTARSWPWKSCRSIWKTATSATPSICSYNFV